MVGPTTPPDASLREGDLTSDVGVEGGSLGEGLSEGAVLGSTVSGWGLSEEGSR
jgi:hypothetical protein